VTAILAFLVLAGVVQAVEPEKLALRRLAGEAVQLRGLHGDGLSAVGHGPEHPFTLNYDLV